MTYGLLKLILHLLQELALKCGETASKRSYKSREMTDKHNPLRVIAVHTCTLKYKTSLILPNLGQSTHKNKNKTNSLT